MNQCFYQAGLVNWGKMQSLKKQYEAEPNHWTKYKIDKNEQVRLQHLRLPFILLGIGTTTAVLVFVCELRRGKRVLSEI